MEWHVQTLMWATAWKAEEIRRPEWLGYKKEGQMFQKMKLEEESLAGATQDLEFVSKKQRQIKCFRFAF